MNKAQDEIELSFCEHGSQTMAIQMNPVWLYVKPILLLAGC